MSRCACRRSGATRPKVSVLPDRPARRRTYPADRVRSRPVFDPLTRPKLPGGRRAGPRFEPFLFLALEAARPARASARFALASVDEVTIGRGPERRCQREIDRGSRRLTIEIPDPWMSRRHARIVRRGSSFAVADLGSSNGTLVNGAPVASAELRDRDLLELGHTSFLLRTGMRASASAGDIVEAGASALGLATVVPAFEAQLDELVRIAPSLVSVVLCGPTGTGKEVLAQAVHRASGRSGPLVAVNCGALPDDLVESELFGHRRGAFSGAVADRTGLIPSADRGTLFLDEIGDLPLPAQAALLRALQDRAVRPVGGTAAAPVDFRVIAATHRDLPAMVRAGTFREDLWARLDGFSFELPPLAERKEDLGTLVAHLGERLAPTRSLVLTPDAARALLRHSWSRNVRELEKVLEAALALAGPAEIDVPHLPAAITDGVPRSGIFTLPPEDDSDGAEPVSVDDATADAGDDDPRRAALIAALREHGGNVSAVARALGKPRSQIQRWMRRWGLRGGDT
jgi:sigma-54 dependent transcriptional regulator, acetoin dehydrogenase operon transcriptional activator AcoR